MTLRQARGAEYNGINEAKRHLNERRYKMENVKTIRVTGKSKIRARPDTTRLTLTLEGADPRYAGAVEASGRDTGALKDALAEQGFGRDEVKTLSFGVEPRYESYQENGAYRQRLTGYQFHHTLKVEFPSDNGRLGRILSALSSCPVDPEIHISFTVSDPEKVKNELLSGAVADAREKAAVLANAAGVELAGVRSVDYSWAEAELVVRPMARALNAKLCADEATVDLTPDDIETEDTVTVVWEIVG